MNIVEEIGLEAVLGQLAEEAAELAQAALKLQRIVHGTNPTPVTKEEAWDTLVEEQVDVILCCDVLHRGTLNTPRSWQDYHRKRSLTYQQKYERWEQRIREARGEGKC